MNLESPHNDERCVCSSDETLRNYAERDAAMMYKDFSEMMHSHLQSIKMSMSMAVEMTGKYKSKQCTSDISETMDRWHRDAEALSKELMSELEAVIVEDAVRKCPYCQ